MTKTTYEVLYAEVDESPKVLASQRSTKASASKALFDRLVNRHLTDAGDIFEVYEYVDNEVVRSVRIEVDEIYDYDEDDD